MTNNITISAEELHAHLLELTKEIHAFCVKYNIKYYIIGGTCLGARRHKGFIPWDDDVDIGIPREDYNRFIEMQDKLPKHLEIIYYKNNKKTPMHYIKLIDNRTTLIEKQYTNLVEGLYIDVFPLDEMGDIINNKKEKVRFAIIRILFVMVVNHCRTDIPTKSSFLRNVFRYISRCISLSWLHNQIERLLTKNNIKNPVFMGNILGAWGKKEIVLKSVFGEPTLYQFEDTFLFGPQKVDNYLEHVYGDFLKLPPVEQRVFTHDYYFLNLNKPYRTYIHETSK